MVYENLKLMKRNFTVDQGYFYMFDEAQDNLLQKTDDGNTSFTYPFDILMEKEVLSTEYTDPYFWSLENSDLTNEMVIKRWKIDNYICKLQQTFNFPSANFEDDFNDETYSGIWTSVTGTNNPSITEYASVVYPIFNGGGDGSSNECSLTTNIDSTTDFYLRIHFNFSMSAVNQTGRFEIVLLDDLDNEKIKMRYYDGSESLYSITNNYYIDGVESYSHDSSNNNIDYSSLNKIILIRTGSNFTYLSNDVEEYNGSTSSSSISKIKLQWTTIAANRPDSMSVDYVIFSEAAGHFDSEAFSVEHYHTTLNGATASGTSTLYLNKYSDHSSMDFKSTNGDGVILHIGPNSNGEEEDVEVATTISGGVTISGTTQYGYTNGDKVNYYTNIWMFNNYDGLNNTGSLCKFDAYTGDYLTRYGSGAYKDVSAATFYNVDSFADYGDVDTLAYVKGTNTLFINTGQAGATLPYYGSMVMDNVQDDEATVIKIYDMVMDDQNVYRLQKKATYYGSTTSWTYYSYQLSSLDSFVTSISLAAYPAIIAANQVSTSDIVAIVKDQFFQPIVARLVTFTDDNTLGVIIGSPDNTDADGKAQVVYKSGTDATEVKITAVVEQT